MKRYTLLSFPSYLGSPREFRTKFFAWLAAKRLPGFVHELKDNRTGKYYAYWV